MVTKLRNDISSFQQLPEESLFEAWERYKLGIDRCPNHNILHVTIIDTFYNGLTLRHRDTINAAGGGTFMKRTPEECHDLIENMTAHHNFLDSSAERSDSCKSITPASNEIAALTKKLDDSSTAMLRMYQTNQNHQVKVVSQNLKLVEVHIHIPSVQPPVASLKRTHMLHKDPTIREVTLTNRKETVIF